MKGWTGRSRCQCPWRLASWISNCIGKAKPYVVVPVAGAVVVPVRYPNVGGVIVPRTTTNNPVRAMDAFHPM